MRGPTGRDVQQQTHRGKRHDQAARPVGDKRQWHPRERGETEDCEHIQQRLGDDQRSHTDGDQGAVEAPSGLGCTQAGIGDQAVEEQQRRHSHDSELLTDDREDEVGVGLREIEDLLHRLAWTDTEQTAGADRDLSLHRLKTAP
jgi:hypothetical protein